MARRLPFVQRRWRAKRPRNDESLRPRRRRCNEWGREIRLMNHITIEERLMRNTVAAAMIGLVIALLNAPAEGRWRIDAEGGASVPITNVDIGEEQFRPNAGPSFTIGGGYAPTKYLELGAQFQNSFAVDSWFGDESVDVYSFTAGPRVYLLPDGPVQPWLIGQIGWYRASGSVDDCFIYCDSEHQSREDDTFGLNVGGGVDMPVTDLVSLGVDVRYNNAFDALGGLQFVTTMFNVGFHFGGQD